MIFVLKNDILQKNIKGEKIFIVFLETNHYSLK